MYWLLNLSKIKNLIYNKAKLGSLYFQHIDTDYNTIKQPITNVRITDWCEYPIFVMHICADADAMVVEHVNVAAQLWKPKDVLGKKDVLKRNMWLTNCS